MKSNLHKLVWAGMSVIFLVIPWRAWAQSASVQQEHSAFVMQVSRPLLKVARSGLSRDQSRSSNMRLQGGSNGGGGDDSEMRVDEIRTDLLKWILGPGPLSLKQPRGRTNDQYVRAMYQILSPERVILSFVSTEQENSTQDLELRVSVPGNSLACRSFFGRQDREPHLLCNIERFDQTSETDQYITIHHQYAVLAGLEQNSSNPSAQSISNQLSLYLASQDEITGVHLQAERSTTNWDSTGWNLISQMSSSANDRQTQQKCSDQGAGAATCAALHYKQSHVEFRTFQESQTSLCATYCR